MIGLEAAATLAYVYAVGRDAPVLDEAAAQAGTSGVAAAPVRVVRAEGFGALVADVPADQYGEEGMKAQLDDLLGLERTARAHHAVVAAAFGTGTVLPMRLATVYLNDSRVAAMMAARAGEFDSLLSRLDGKLEWGVKVYADPRQARRTESEAPAAASGPGRAYLQQRRAQRDDRRLAYLSADALIDRVMEQAREFAVAEVRHRPQQGALTQGSGENVANLAFLVPSARGDAFRAAMDGLDVHVLDGAPSGARVEITGPWAPYSFATSAPEGSADARLSDGLHPRSCSGRPGRGPATGAGRPAGPLADRRCRGHRRRCPVHCGRGLGAHQSARGDPFPRTGRAVPLVECGSSGS